MHQQLIALGAILHQKGNDGLEHVIAYKNKTQNKIIRLRFGSSMGCGKI